MSARCRDLIVVVDVGGTLPTVVCLLENFDPLSEISLRKRKEWLTICKFSGLTVSLWYQSTLMK